MSRLPDDLDRVLGTVRRRQPNLLLLARRHGTVAKDCPVPLVVLAEKAGGKVIAAAMALAALGADLRLHRVIPI
jgi:hypothetical protein